jgi:protein ImuB
LVAEPLSRFGFRQQLPRGATPVPRRTACIALPNWPIQRLVVSAPVYRRAPLVLFTETGNRGQLVTAASPRAQLSGVRIGMPLAEAKSLLRRSAAGHAAMVSGSTAASPTFLPAQPQTDRQELAALARSLQDFSPRVGTLSAPGQGSGHGGEPQFAIWLDLTGVAHLFGDHPGAEWNLLCRVRDRLATAGYLATAAVADTPGAAWALACYGRPRSGTGGKTGTVSPPKIPAPDESENPLWRLPVLEPMIAPLSSEWTLLDPLPPIALRLDPLLCLTLGQLGITRIGQLRQLPRASLQARFGPQLGRRLDEVAGVATEIWTPLDESLDFTLTATFDFPLRDLATIEVVIERQLDQLCARLRPLQRGALQWQIALHGESGGGLPRSPSGQAELEQQSTSAAEFAEPWHVARLVINLFQPTATVAHVMQLIALQLEQQRDLDLEATPVWEVSVRAARCVLLAEKQRLLFDDDPRLDHQALSQLLDRLAVRLGPERIVRPVPVSGAQPEFACRPHILVGNDQAPPRVVAPRREHAAISRPVRLLQPPSPLAVTADVTTGAPQQLHHSRWRAQVLAAWGPERIETGWWRGRLISRDYWRVQTSAGQLLWVYQDQANQQWFLHGTF